MNRWTGHEKKNDETNIGDILLVTLLVCCTIQIHTFAQRPFRYNQMPSLVKATYVPSSHHVLTLRINEVFFYMFVSAL